MRQAGSGQPPKRPPPPARPATNPSSRPPPPPRRGPGRHQPGGCLLGAEAASGAPGAGGLGGRRAGPGRAGCACLLVQRAGRAERSGALAALGAATSRLTARAPSTYPPPASPHPPGRPPAAAADASPLLCLASRLAPPLLPPPRPPGRSLRSLPEEGVGVRASASGGEGGLRAAVPAGPGWAAPRAMPVCRCPPVLPARLGARPVHDHRAVAVAVLVPTPRLFAAKRKARTSVPSAPS